MVLSYWICGHLLQQQSETNIGMKGLNDGPCLMKGRSSCLPFSPLMCLLESITGPVRDQHLKFIVQGQRPVTLGAVNTHTSKINSVVTHEVCQRCHKDSHLSLKEMREFFTFFLLLSCTHLHEILGRLCNLFMLA